jgi:hypothetical protein
LSVIPAGNGVSVQFRVRVSGIPANVPTGSITFKLTPSDLSKTPSTLIMPLQNGETLWETPAPSEDYAISARYSGDANYQATDAISSGKGKSLPPDFDFATSTIVLKQGQTWSGRVQVIPINGFAKSISFVCTAPPALSCNLGTNTYNVAQPSGTSSANGIPLNIVTYSGEFVASSFFLLPILSMRQRKTARSRIALAAILSLACFLPLLGCVDNSRVGWQPITPKGKYQVQITGSASGVEHVKELTVIVE